MTQESEMTLKDHVKELRSKVIFCLSFFFISFIGCYMFSQDIYQFLLKPFLEISQESDNRRLIYTNPTEAFFTYIKLSFYSALFISFPVFLSQLYFFIAPGLYKNEKKNILLILFFCPFLFISGALLVYYFILPLALQFFIGFEVQHSLNSLPIHLETKISEYLSLVIKLFFGFGIAFQLPILLIFLIKIGILSYEDLKSKRRYWILAIFIIAALLTPPDILSQLSLAILMIILFEMVLLFCKKET